MNKEIEFHKKLRYFRKCHSFTQEEVANALGIHKSTYAHYEAGNRSPNQEALLKLSRLFQTTADELLSPHLPLVIKIKIPDDLLDALENAIKQYGEVSNDWNKNKDNLDQLELASQPVFNYRQNAYENQDARIITDSNSMSDIFIKSVILDPRGEKLIFEYLKLYQKIVRSLWQRKEI